MKYNNRWFFLLDQVISITLGTLLLVVFFSLYKSYSDSSNELNTMQQNYQVINQWLTVLQKIVFEKGKYLWFKDGNLSFSTIENGLEKTYFLKLDDCTIPGRKTLYYQNADTRVNLFSNQCLVGITSVDYVFLNPDIKEKLTRVRINTTYGTFFTPLFVWK